MTTPNFEGPGYFAGEAPDGLTTVTDVPVPAQVRVYWRDPADAAAQEVLVKSTTSASDGTWRITDVNPELKYIVRGIKEGFNDVSINDVMPTRTDQIVATGAFDTNSNFDGIEGQMLLEGGLPPYALSILSPLPLGLVPSLEYRTLSITGTSSQDGLWESVLRVTSENGVSTDIEVSVVIHEAVVLQSSVDYIVPTGVFQLTGILVAGGGGGGSRQGGGGGAGGFRRFTLDVVPGQVVPIKVGLGGVGGVNGGPGSNGQKTSVGDIEVQGGGGGGGRTTQNQGLPGGSGGGAVNGATSAAGALPGKGTTGQGFDGGPSTKGNLGGGGGGAGAAGQSALDASGLVPSTGAADYTADAGRGGDGIYVSEFQKFGDDGWFAGGGGAGGYNTRSVDGGGRGGRGGGGKGNGVGKDSPATAAGPGGPGKDGTGGGGGGSGIASSPGGDGGDGVVIFNLKK